ncbi:MAG: hypothetical protein HY541_01780 [Deltaproteobacteria bacterium]|nr:hypothetical protein [Deltaproteobacteria bacterium]
MKTFVLLFLLFVTACGGDNSATGATETGNSIGAALTSIFGGENESAGLTSRRLFLARLTDLFTRKATAQEERQTACEVIADETAPSDVETSLSIEAGTYGAPSNPITVSADDDCEDGGEYASFNVVSHPLDCVNGAGETSTLLMVNSSGIWRENTVTNNTEIYGTFNIQLGDETAENIRCSLLIEHDENDEPGDTGTFSGVCEDENGNAVEQSSDLTCTDTE